MDALALLRADHVAILDMLDELEHAPADGRPVTPEDLPARQRLVTELVKAESAHEALEEKYFWPSVRNAIPEGNDLASAAVEQESAAKHVLAELDKREAGEPEFERLVSRLIADARAHIAYEENQVWPAVRRGMSRGELNRLGKKMAKARKFAPTRPHPRTPPTPGALKTVGTAAASADRARDVVTGRQGGTDPAWTRGRAGRQGETTRSRWSDIAAVALMALLVVAAFRRHRHAGSRRREHRMAH